jgi:hypothetical protein
VECLACRICKFDNVNRGFRGVVLKDLLYIEESNKDYRSDGTLNLGKGFPFNKIAKFLLIGDIILMVQSYQRKGHDVVRNSQIYDMIYRDKRMSTKETDLYETSLEYEPRK